MSIAEVIRNKKDEILERWKEQLLEEIPEVKRHDKSAIENSVPELIDALVKVLISNDDKKVVHISHRHALDRSRFQIYSLKHIVKEYNFLKREIFKVTDENEEVHPGDRDIIMYAIDVAIEEAAETFYRVRQGVQVDARSMAEEKADTMQLQDDNREQFIRSITHDLNNPLTNIKGCLALLENDPDVNETATILKMLKTSTGQAESLIKEFLDVSEVNPVNKLPIRRERVRIMEELQNEVAVYRIAHRNQIHIECNDEALEAELDVGLFRRAFNNIMNNAIKHGAKAPIEIHCRVENDEVAISVVNQGRLITPSEKKHIFDRYYKTERGRRGWGIGLAFVKEVIRAHDGKIDVESEEGRGTVFTMRFPQTFSS